MKQTIYAVESGEYSDYGIDALFSTREKAERYIKECSGHYDTDPRVCEWILDEDDDKIRRDVFTTTMDIESGEVLRAWTFDAVIDKNARAGDIEISDLRWTPSSPTTPEYGRLTCKVFSYVSADHSVKLAAEVRQSYIREKSLT